MGKGILGLIFVAFFVCFVVIKYLLVGASAAYKAVFEEGENNVTRALTSERVNQMHSVAAPNAQRGIQQGLLLDSSRIPGLAKQQLPSSIREELIGVVKFSLLHKGFNLESDLHEALIDAADSVCMQLASYGHFMPIKEGYIIARNVAVDSKIIREEQLRAKNI